MTIKEQAMQWWAEQIKNSEHVVSADEAPNQRQREFLVKGKFLYQAAKGYWILKRPEDQIEEVFPLHYWQIADKILSHFNNWSIRGQSALALYNGDQVAQKRLLVRTKEKTNRKISLMLEHDLSLVYDPDFDQRLVKRVETAGLSVPVDVPEKVLVDIGKPGLSDNVLSFIAGTQFNLRILEAIYAKNPKPIVFKRLAGMAKEAKRPDLVVGLEQTIETHTHYRVAKRETIDAEPITKQPVVITPPWVIRQEQQIKQFEKVLEQRLERQIVKLSKHNVDDLTRQAKEHKKYDTYHSTTLEGYRITQEEVDALLSGVAPEGNRKQGGKYFEEQKNRMAILGYSEAFDFIINQVQKDFDHPHISEEFVKDSYYHLFKPSADAEIIDYLSLVSYRDMPAFIRGTSYVPPSKEKVPELMTSYVLNVNKVRNPVVKSMLAHYFFVTIHPYTDGNGRTARLLMNYLLLTTGHRWLTIRADQRVEYFDALKAGQVNGDIVPFGEFIIGLLEKS